jgi:prephenate dehydratase
MRVAFQGERGAYSEEAAATLLDKVEVLPCPSLREVFQMVTRGEAETGVIPVENSQAGSINETYDLLLSHTLWITGEIDLRIRHNLLALPGQDLASISKVYSHPQALAQSEAFLHEHNLEAIPASDTAGSAKVIAEQRLVGVGAIASLAAARIYGLTVLREGIETNPENFTRFLAIAPKPTPRRGASKTSIVFTTENKPGALHRALGAFASRAIDLTKLESRPRRQRPWEYLFYVDLDGHQEDPPLAAALQELGTSCIFVRVLGSYPKAGVPR